MEAEVELRGLRALCLDGLLPHQEHMAQQLDVLFLQVLHVLYVSPRDALYVSNCLWSLILENNYLFVREKMYFW